MQNVFGQRCARNIIKGYGTPLKSNNWNAIYAPQDNSNYWGVRVFLLETRMLDHMHQPCDYAAEALPCAWHERFRTSLV